MVVSFINPTLLSHQVRVSEREVDCECSSISFFLFKYYNSMFENIKLSFDHFKIHQIWSNVIFLVN